MKVTSRIALMSLMLMFFLPFIVSYHKWPEPQYYVEMVAFILGSTSLMVFLQSNSKTIPIPYMTILPLVLSGIIVLQWLVGIGQYWQQPALGVVYLVWSTLLMLATVQLKEQVGSKTMITWLSYGLLAGGLFNALVVFMQLIGQDHYFWTYPKISAAYTGNVAQQNLLTDYTSLSIASLLYLYFRQRVGLRMMSACLLLLLVVLSLTGSRMSWLYLMMIAFSFFWYARKSESTNWNRSYTYILMLPVIFGVIQFIFPYVVSLFGDVSASMPTSPTERLLAQSDNKSARLSFINQALDIFSDYPLLGVGWGQFPWYDLLFASKYPNHNGYLTHSHNIYIQVLAECGLFAFATLLVFSIYWFVKILQKERSLENWWVLIIASIVFAHSMLEYPLWYANFLAIFSVAIALEDNVVELNVRHSIIPKTLAAMMLMVASSVIIVTNHQYKQIERWVATYPKMSKHERNIMLSKMTEMQPNTLVAEPLHMILTRAYSMLPRAQAPLASKIAKYEAMLHYTQAEHDIYRYILLLAIDGQIHKANQFLVRAYNRQPTYSDKFEKQIEGHAKKGVPNFEALYRTLKQIKASRAQSATGG